MTRVGTLTRQAARFYQALMLMKMLLSSNGVWKHNMRRTYLPIALRLREQQIGNVKLAYGATLTVNSIPNTSSKYCVFSM